MFVNTKQTFSIHQQPRENAGVQEYIFNSLIATKKILRAFWWNQILLMATEELDFLNKDVWENT